VELCDKISLSLSLSLSLSVCVCVCGGGWVLHSSSAQTMPNYVQNKNVIIIIRQWLTETRILPTHLTDAEEKRLEETRKEEEFIYQSRTGPSRGWLSSLSYLIYFVLEQRGMWNREKISELYENLLCPDIVPTHWSCAAEIFGGDFHFVPYDEKSQNGRSDQAGFDAAMVSIPLRTPKFLYWKIHSRSFGF